MRTKVKVLVVLGEDDEFVWQAQEGLTPDQVAAKLRRAAARMETQNRAGEFDRLLDAVGAR